MTEYQQHRLGCSHCGATTCAELPPGVPAGQSGPRLIAFTALLMAYYRQSKRRTAQFLSTLLGQPCCPALTVKMQTIATAAARPAYAELAARLPPQNHLSIDETASKEADRKAWLWTFVARRFTVFALRPTREATALVDMLGEDFRGIITCDRAKMYWQAERLQWCWAHLARDFQAMIDRGDASARQLGYRLRADTRRLFQHWRAFRAGEISQLAMVRRMGPVRRSVEKLLRRGAQSSCRVARGMCRELDAHRDRLWRFVRQSGVEPTNNASERALRQAVIWRKLSFGTQSAAGSRFVETMLTVIETCRQQGRDVLAFLSATIQAHLAHQPPPAILAKA